MSTAEDKRRALKMIRLINVELRNILKVPWRPIYYYFVYREVREKTEQMIPLLDEICQQRDNTHLIYKIKHFKPFFEFIKKLREDFIQLNVLHSRGDMDGKKKIINRLIVQHPDTLDKFDEFTYLMNVKRRVA